MTTFIIAEMGSTHAGSLERALRILRDSADAGASAFKGQFWSESQAVAARLNAPELEPMYESVRMPREWLAFLSENAHHRGMEFLCTVDLFEDIPVVAPYVDRFKIASMEAHDEPFLEAHAAYGKPMVISYGMQDETRRYRNVHPLGRVWRQQGIKIPEVWHLHCVSGYPTPLDEVNLEVVRSAYHDREEGQLFDGFSDHTANVLMGAFAVCAGARILEVHVRADDTPEDNPDFPHSLPPARFREYVENVRLAETMLGDGVKRIMPCEQPTLRHRVTVEGMGRGPRSHGDAAGFDSPPLHQR